MSLFQRLGSPIAATVVGVMSGQLCCRFSKSLLTKNAGIYIWLPYWDDKVRADERRLEQSTGSDLGPNMLEIPVEQVKKRQPTTSTN